MTILVPRGRVSRFGILLLSPVLALCVAAILIGLLGIFVLWLSIVGVLIAAIVLSDVASRSARRWLEAPMPTVPRRAIG